MQTRYDFATPDTLEVTHICDGEEYVMGGQHGQVWIATFASPNAAQHFIRYAVENAKTFEGIIST